MKSQYLYLTALSSTAGLNDQSLTLSSAACSGRSIEDPLISIDSRKARRMEQRKDAGKRKKRRKETIKVRYVSIRRDISPS